MCEAENCVSVHLFPSASSSVSSTKGKEKGQALPQLLWVCWIEERKFYLFLLPPKKPHNAKDLQRVW